jgi:hypothetical protein
LEGEYINLERNVLNNGDEYIFGLTPVGARYLRENEKSIFQLIREDKKSLAVLILSSIFSIIVMLLSRLI